MVNIYLYFSTACTICFRSVSNTVLRDIADVNSQFCEKLISIHFMILLVVIFQNNKFVSTRVVLPSLVMYLSLGASVLKILK